MTKSSTVKLPAYTKVENLMKLVNVLKRKNKNDDDAKALFDMGDATYSNTKTALKIFEIIQNDSLEFTEFGNTLAYSNDERRKTEFAVICKDFEPYELFLLRLLESTSKVTVTTNEELINFFGRNNFGSTDRNRKDAAQFFMGILDYVGLGAYLMGRGKKNPTRFEWNEDYATLLSSIFTVDNPAEKKNENKHTDVKDEIQNNSKELTVESNKKGIEKEIVSKKLNLLESPNDSRLAITINVDMSDWPLDKIKEFFRFAHGNFDKG